MKRKVLAITGSRAEYGAMRPVFRAITRSSSLELEMIVTGMHLAPQFRSSLAEIESDDFCPRHTVETGPVDGSPLGMARALGESVMRMASSIEGVAPEMVLVQGDRGEMLAASLAAAHLNIPVAHMSGGDRTGSIDDSIRNAITAVAHVHLTTCAQSATRVLATGEPAERVFVVGEPALDVILQLDPTPWPELAAELHLNQGLPVILATQHPVTTEARHASEQVTETLEALAVTGMQTVFTYPNTDAGGADIVRVIEVWRNRPFLRIVPHLGSRKYLSLMRAAAVLVGNSSSGIIEAPSFKVPVVNIGTRQHCRTRACNVIDAGYDRHEIRAAIERALGDSSFRKGLGDCLNPYGDGRCAERTTKILAELPLQTGFTAKWLVRGASATDR